MGKQRSDKQAKNQQTEEQTYLQSQSPFEDPDTPVPADDAGHLRPLTFKEMTQTNKIKKSPRFDMDSDLGA
jgi:hypothetical protein